MLNTPLIEIELQPDSTCAQPFG